MVQAMNRLVVLSLALTCALGSRTSRGQPANPERKGDMTTPSAPMPHAHTNRLAREKSPYLLQHQFNPVDWYAWGEEAFAKARQENRPIFLSIGYSTCHWCHVMERESFENDEVARYLNQHFVCIKVDREERPDVDKIYMNFVQGSTGQGGWPLNAFLTPELKPFFGGTYFPPESRYGRPSFMQMLQKIHEVWADHRSDILDSAARINDQLQTGAKSGGDTNLLALTAEPIRAAGRRFKETFDPRHGGFGDAPKFPQPSVPQFLLRYAKRFHDAEAQRMVLRTCDRMAAGGIHDQLGGGFARYSVDAEWLVPHFEKMLYDNAQLAQLYLDAYLISGDAHHASVVRDILGYVLRDMTHPQGGFYSAEDADSEGQEGKFYCWTRQELAELLSPEELKTTVGYFGITEHGNFVDHSHPRPLPNLNVLSLVHTNLSTAQQAALESAKSKMLAARSQRVRPHLDDKVLASWNGLMLGALARAHVVLGDPAYRVAAEKNAAFLKEKLWDAGSKTLYHRWRDGERDQVQLLEGYAFLLSGVVELYEATLRPEHLEWAISLAEAMLARFYDPDQGGFWHSAETKDLIVRLKPDYDGAEPSGNSVAVMALLKLGKITDRKDFIEPAEKSMRRLASQCQQVPQAVPYLLQALDFFLDEPKRAVVAGDASGAEPQALLRAVHSVYQPNKVVLGTQGPVEPFAKTLAAKDGSLVYVCTGTACLPPTNDAAKIRDLLK
jgi:uncharacterized protein YyaL (SSP411 family)